MEAFLTYCDSRNAGGDCSKVRCKCPIHINAGCCGICERSRCDCPESDEDENHFLNIKDLLNPAESDEDENQDHDISDWLQKVLRKCDDRMSFQFEQVFEDQDWTSTADWLAADKEDCKRVLTDLKDKARTNREMGGLDAYRTLKHALKALEAK
mmetsp:Transcript_28750/g.39197  ORF Transcript_28750/g.39197 Transcript_28750/m.39197 type:complete len:154 (-) Transcript_28750:153-614(-)